MPPQQQKPPARKPDRPPTPPCPVDRYTEPGSIVLHYSDLSADTKPALAIVTSVGIDAIDVQALIPNNVNLYPYNGVHHREHQAALADREGLWLPRPIDVAVLRFMIAQGAVVWDGESRYVEKAQAPTAPTAPTAPAKP